MKYLKFSDNNISVTINYTDQVTQYEILLRAIQTLLNNIDPRCSIETRQAPYIVLYARLLSMIAQHMSDFTDMDPLETMTIKELLIEEVILADELGLLS